MGHVSVSGKSPQIRPSVTPVPQHSTGPLRAMQTISQPINTPKAIPWPKDFYAAEKVRRRCIGHTQLHYNMESTHSGHRNHHCS